MKILFDYSLKKISERLTINLVKVNLIVNAITLQLHDLSIRSDKVTVVTVTVTVNLVVNISLSLTILPFLLLRLTLNVTVPVTETVIGVTNIH